MSYFDIFKTGAMAFVTIGNKSNLSKIVYIMI